MLIGKKTRCECGGVMVDAGPFGMQYWRCADCGRTEKIHLSHIGHNISIDSAKESKPRCYLCPICGEEVVEVDSPDETGKLVLDERRVTLFTLIGGRAFGTLLGHREHFCRAK